MIVVGIDPGKQGGIAFMVRGKDCKAFPLPIVDRKVDVGKLQELIIENCTAMDFGGHVYAFVEVQQIRSGNRGNLLIGENYGRITAMLDLLTYSTEEVHAWDWKKALFPGKKTKGNKEISIKRCLDEGYDLPTLKPAGKKLHDGIADAICIALYGLKKLETS